MKAYILELGSSKIGIYNSTATSTENRKRLAFLRWKYATIPSLNLSSSVVVTVFMMERVAKGRVSRHP